ENILASRRHAKEREPVGGTPVLKGVIGGVDLGTLRLTVSPQSLFAFERGKKYVFPYRPRSALRHHLIPKPIVVFLGPDIHPRARAEVLVASVEMAQSTILPRPGIGPGQEPREHQREGGLRKCLGAEEREGDSGDDDSR